MFGAAGNGNPAQVNGERYGIGPNRIRPLNTLLMRRINERTDTMPHCAVSLVDKTKGKLLYLVTEDWYFCSHRLPLARVARDAGFEVVVATRVAKHEQQILEAGFLKVSKKKDIRRLG